MSDYRYTHTHTHSVLNVSPDDKICFPHFMQENVCMLIICNHLIFSLFCHKLNVFNFVFHFCTILSLFGTSDLNTCIYLQYKLIGCFFS